MVTNRFGVANPNSMRALRAISEHLQSKPISRYTLWGWNLCPDFDN